MAEIHQFGGSDASSLHTFAAEEKMAFSEHINQCLDFDPTLHRHLPLNPNSDDLFTKTSDGLILCKLINLAVNDTIDERALNKKEGMSIYNKAENLNLALNAAKSIGCQVVNIGSQDLMDGKPILILGLVWQIIRIQLLSQITLKNCPELVLLLEPEETLAQFMKLPPEHILLRWINWHLTRGGSDRRIKNFGHDVMDSEIYSVLLNRLDPDNCPSVIGNDPLGRATQVVRNSNAMGARTFIQPADICSGNKKLNISFCAQIFNVNHGLRPDSPEGKSEPLPELPDFAALDTDLSEEVSREEIVFRNWINSLNLENVYIHNDLFGALEDGVILIKIIDTVEPGVITWKRVNMEPKSKYKRIENCNYAVDVSKNALKFSLVGVGGVDVVDQNAKLVLALVWQMLRKYTLNMLSSLATSQGIDSMSEDRIVEWANQKVLSGGSTRRMRSFKDPAVKNGLFFLDLLTAIEPRAVNPEIITPGETQEEMMLNAKYSISVARKIGACVFLSPADIVEGKVKMLFTFCASLWMAELLQVQNMKNG